MASLFPESLTTKEFSPLFQCADSSADHSCTTLLLRSAAHLEKIRQAHFLNAFVILKPAEAVCLVFGATLQTWDDLPPYSHRWLKGTMTNFCLSSVLESDFSSPIGFDDDVAIMNACLKLVGREGLCLNPEPIIQACKGEQTEAQTIFAWAVHMMDSVGLKPHEICITPYKAAIVTALTDAKIPILQLKPHETDPGEDEPGIRLGIIKRIKGLEFRAIAQTCADPSDPMNDLSRADVLDRCERYVAATRTRGQLLVTLEERCS